ncbi:unnamed protein product [Prunus armeniaca]
MLTEECSVVLLKQLPPKLKDPGSFTIPCIIGDRLDIGELKSTAQFVFLADFFVLNMEEDHDIPLLLVWPFLATAGTLIDVQQGTLTLRVQGKSIECKVFEVVKKLGDLKECNCIDLLDPIVHVNYLEITSMDVLKAKLPSSPYVKHIGTSLDVPKFINVLSKAFRR